MKVGTVHVNVCPPGKEKMAKGGFHPVVSISVIPASWVAVLPRPREGHSLKGNEVGSWMHTQAGAMTVPGGDTADKHGSCRHGRRAQWDMQSF